MSKEADEQPKRRARSHVSAGLSCHSEATQVCANGSVGAGILQEFSHSLALASLSLVPQQNDLRKLERIQQNTTKMIKELRNETNNGRIHTPRIFLLMEKAEGRMKNRFQLKAGMRN